MKNTLASLAAIAAREKKSLYIVGGFVRDSLLGKESRDVDMVVKDEAEQFAKHVAWLLRGEYELLDSFNQFSRVTVDADDGKPLFLDFSLMKGGRLEEDLCNRDFTVNAMAVSLDEYLERGFRRGKLVDPFNGMADLQAGIIRLTAGHCLRDDPVRLFRAVRFRLKLGFVFAPETLAELRKEAVHIRRANKIKLAMELFQILSRDDATEALRCLMDEIQVLDIFFPPFQAMRSYDSENGNLLAHGLRSCACLDEILAGKSGLPQPLLSTLITHLSGTLRDVRKRVAYLRLACLTHDIGKLDSQPGCGNNQRMFSHELAGEVYVDSLSARLQLNEEEERYLAALVCGHTRPCHLSLDAEGLAARLRLIKQYQEMTPELFLLAMANDAAKNGYGTECQKSLAALLGEYFTMSWHNLPEPLISAREIMEFFRLPPTRAVGRLLEEMYLKQLAGEVKNRSEAFSSISRLLELHKN